MISRTRRTRTLAALALAAGLVGPAVAPSLAPQRTLASSTHALAHASDGILRMADEGENDLKSIDPPSPNSSDAQSNVVQNLIFGNLVRQDQNLNIQPNGAASWETSNGGRVYTFTLRSGLKFADGTPVTSADVVYTLNRAFAPEYSSGLVDYYLGHIVGGPPVSIKKAKTVAGVTAIGPNKVRVTLDQPEAVILNQLAYSVAAIVPRRLIEKYGSSWTDHAVGTGPFYVKQWKHGQEIDLAPNPYYWRGKPKLKGLNVEFIQSAETAYNLYHTGGVDVMGVVNFPSNHIKDVRGTPDLHAHAHLFTELLTLNENGKPFNNPLVRQAFSYAVNRDTVVKLLNGRFLPAHSLLPPGMPGYNSSLAGQTFDVNRARQLLAKAGYPNGQGFPKVTLNIDGGDNDGQTKAVALKEFWKRVLNVDVGLNQLEHSAYIAALTARKYQIAFIQWGADYPDPQDFLSLLLQTRSGGNNGGYSNPTFDRLTRQADVLPHSSPQRYRLYQQAERIAMDDAPIVVLDWGESYILIRPSVHGLSVNGLGLVAPNWADVTVG